MYRGIESKGAPDAIEGLYMTSIFEPGVACAKSLHIGFCLGAMVAVRRSVLDAIGGFWPMCDYLADDFRLGQMVRKAGYRVVLSDYVVEIAMAGERFGDVLARQLRWSRTLRVCNPLGHFGLIVTHGFPFALLFWVLSNFSTFGWTVLLSSTVMRYITAYIGSRLCLQDREFSRRLHLLPASDLLSLSTWAAAYFSRTVRWRKRKLRLSKDGRIVRAEPSRLND
jgi:ceramide glucosyltransferase